MEDVDYVREQLEKLLLIGEDRWEIATEGSLTESYQAGKVDAFREACILLRDVKPSINIEQ